MARRTIAVLAACGLTTLALIFESPAVLKGANKSAPVSKLKRPIRNPKFDPSAAQVDLFGAVDAGHVSIRLIPTSAMGGNVLIENRTDQPLTVKIPEAVVGVSIHAQAGGFGFGNPGQAQGQGNAGAGNVGNGAQAIGGVIAPAQGNGQGQGQVAPGPGFFSIPAEKVVSLRFNSVCLEHGKSEPGSTSKYTLAPVSRFSHDPVLYQLLTNAGKDNVDSKALQAAAWHVTDKMSFQELSEKFNTPLGMITQTPEFTRDQILAAQDLVERAKQRCAEKNPAGTIEPKSNLETTATIPVRVATN